MPGSGLDPIIIPVWAWQREATCHLLQERDIAGLLHFAQQYGGASQTQLAAATGIAQGRISEILNGQKSVSAFEVFERIANGLNMPDMARMMFGLAPKTPIPGEVSTPAVTTAPTLAPGADSAGQQEESVKRREFVGLAGSAALGATAVSLIELETFARALTNYTTTIPQPRPQDITLPRLATAVRAAKSGYQACRYMDVARRLPDLLGHLEHAAAHARDDELTTLHVLRAEAYHVAASLLLKSDERGLAGIAAERSMQAAELSENPTTRGASARIVTHTLMDGGHHRAATELAAGIAAQVDRDTTEPTPDSLSVYGALLLRGSVAAARREHRGEAMTLLDEAEDAAARLGGDHNHQWTAFGPTNVLLHRVNIAVALGDAGSALDYAQHVQLDNIDVVERKATLFIDAARAYTQWGKLDRAYESLMTADHFAHQELQRPATHTLINEIGSRATGHLRTNINDLADKAGMAR